MHNEFNLVRLIGLMTLSIGVFMILATFDIIFRMTRVDWEAYYILGFGLFYFLVGVSMLIKLRWTRVVAPILYAASIFSILFYFLGIESIPKNDQFFLFSVLTLPCTLLLCAILFITNEKVIAEYDRGDRASVDESDILDANL